MPASRLCCPSISWVLQLQSTRLPLCSGQTTLWLYGLTSHPYDLNLSFRKTEKLLLQDIGRGSGRWTGRNVGTIYFGQAERWVPFILLWVLETGHCWFLHQEKLQKRVCWLIAQPHSFPALERRESVHPDHTPQRIWEIPEGSPH